MGRGRYVGVGGGGRYVGGGGLGTWGAVFGGRGR